MYLSYSGYATYLGCPQAYWHRYINKTPLLKPDNKVNALYGSVVGVLFEHFYNDKIWAERGSEDILLGKVDATLSEVMSREVSKGGVYDWKAPKLSYRSVEDVVYDIRAAVSRGLATIREHRLIGREAAAEVKLDVDVGGHRMAGRADFVIRRVPPHNDLVLLDGKGSKWRETYVDPKQLHWYATLYEQRYGVVPDKLGFVFWRFEPDNAVDWVPATPEDLVSLRETVLQAMTRIEADKAGLDPVVTGLSEQDRRQALMGSFPATPSKECKLCTYLPGCLDGRNFGAKIPRAPDSGGVDIEDIGFG